MSPGPMGAAKSAISISIKPKRQLGPGKKSPIPTTNYSKVHTSAPTAPEAGSMAQKSVPPRGMEMLPAKVAHSEALMSISAIRQPLLGDMVKAAMAGAAARAQVTPEALRQAVLGGEKTASAPTPIYHGVDTDLVLKIASALDYVADNLNKVADVGTSQGTGTGQGPNALQVMQATSSEKNIDAGQLGSSPQSPAMSPPMESSQTQKSDNTGAAMATNYGMSHSEQPVDPMGNEKGPLHGEKSAAARNFAVLQKIAFLGSMGRMGAMAARRGRSAVGGVSVGRSAAGAAGAAAPAAAAAKAAPAARATAGLPQMVSRSGPVRVPTAAPSRAAGTAQLNQMQAGAKVRNLASRQANRAKTEAIRSQNIAQQGAGGGGRAAYNQMMGRSNISRATGRNASESAIGKIRALQSRAVAGGASAPAFGKAAAASLSPGEYMLWYMNKMAEDAINPAKISAGAAVPPDFSGSEYKVPSQPSDVTRQMALVGSNDKAINYTKGQAKADPKSDVNEVLHENALSKATDPVLHRVLDHTSSAGVKVSSANAKRSHKAAIKTAAARAYLAKLAEEAEAETEKKPGNGNGHNGNGKTEKKSMGMGFSAPGVSTSPGGAMM